jgi:hypothetical protein
LKDGLKVTLSIIGASVVGDKALRSHFACNVITAAAKAII